MILMILASNVAWFGMEGISTTVADVNIAPMKWTTIAHSQTTALVNTI